MLVFGGLAFSFLAGQDHISVCVSFTLFLALSSTTASRWAAQEAARNLADAPDTH
jgi:hypothetical protein